MESAKRLICVCAVALGLATPAWAQSPGMPVEWNIEEIDPGIFIDGASSRLPFTVELLGKPFELKLEPSKLRAREFKIVTHGGGAVSINDSKIFEGVVTTDPYSVVRISVHPEGVRGFVRTGHDWIVIRPAKDPAHPLDHMVFDMDDLDPTRTCDCDEPIHVASIHALREQVSADPRDGSSDAPPAEEGTGMVVLELAVDADVEFYLDHGPNTVAEIESVLNEVDGIYQVELGIRLELTHINYWTVEPDPYNSTDSSALLSEFRNHWNSNFGTVNRDLAHLFTGRDLDGSTVGVAYLGVVCATSVGYGLTQDIGSLTGMVAAHEIGHNLGSSHDPTGSSPRYIMYPSIGGGNLDEFSAASKSAIDSEVMSVSCLALDSGGGGGSVTPPTITPNPPPAPTGGGSSGGGPVDPFVLAALGGVALWERRRRRRHCEGDLSES